MKTIIIGIAGGTGSGKSTFTRKLKKEFKDDVAVLYHDNYYSCLLYTSDAADEVSNV